MKLSLSCSLPELALKTAEKAAQGGGGGSDPSPIFDFPDQVWYLDPAESGTCKNSGIQCTDDQTIDTITAGGSEGAADGDYSLSGDSAANATYLSTVELSDQVGLIGPHLKGSIPAIRCNSAGIIRYESANTGGWQNDYRSTPQTFYALYYAESGDALNPAPYRFNGNDGFIQLEDWAGRDVYWQLGKSGSTRWARSNDAHSAGEWVLVIATNPGDNNEASTAIRINGVDITEVSGSSGTPASTAVSANSVLFKRGSGATRMLLAFAGSVNRVLNASEIDLLEDTVAQEYLDATLLAQWSEAGPMYSDAGTTLCSSIGSDPVQEWHDTVSSEVLSQTGSNKPTYEQHLGGQVMEVDTTNDDWLTLSSSATFNFSKTEKKTFAFYVAAINSPGTARGVLGKGVGSGSTQRGYYIFCTTSDKIRFSLNGGSGGGAFTVDMTDDCPATPFACAISYNGIPNDVNSVEIYIDGVAQSKTLVASNLTSTITNAATFRYGQESIDEPRNFDGQLGELRLYDGVASTTQAATICQEILDQFNWQPTDASIAPLLWVRGDDVDGTTDGNGVSTWPDQSGNANDLTAPLASHEPVYDEDGGPNGTPALLFTRGANPTDTNASVLTRAHPFGNIERDRHITFAMVFKTDYAQHVNLIGKTLGTASNWQGYRLTTLLTSGNMRFILDENDGTANRVLGSIPAVGASTWAAMVWDYQGDSNTSNLQAWESGDSETVTVINNALSESILNTADFALGAGYLTNFQQAIEGAVAEFIMWESAGGLTAADLDNLNEYLVNRYGL